MTTSINWGLLVSKNRAKAVGVAWSKEELKAIHEDGISPEDVRAGILTKDEQKEADKSQTTVSALRRMTKQELTETAKSLKIKFQPDEVTRETLIDMIEVVWKKSGNPKDKKKK